MGKVTALGMDVITEKSGHQVTLLAVRVCLTPAAPSPLPIPYPVVASAAEGIGDAAMRTKVNGAAVRLDHPPPGRVRADHATIPAGSMSSFGIPRWSFT